MLALGDHKRAHVFFVRLVELNPKDARGWIGLSITGESLDEKIISLSYAQSLNSHHETRQQLHALIEQKIAHSGIADVPVLIALGRTVSEVGQRAEAYHLLVRATELDPTNIDGWLWRASVAEQNVEMIQCFEQMLKLDPQNQIAKTGIAWIKQTKIKRGTSAPSVDSNTAAAQFEEGQNAFFAGDIARAHEHFKRATDADPGNEAAWFWRASTAPDTKEALASIERVLKINPQNPSARDARWYLKIKRLRERFPGKLLK
jgi:tetratricopeptide (TPR) repeat protein